MCEALTYLLDNISIRFDTNCAPLRADLFLFCYERDFMASLSYNKEAEIIQAFNSTSRSLFLIIKKLKLFKHLTHN